MAIHLSLASRSTTPSRARKLARQGSWKCLHQTKELSVAMSASQWVTTTRHNASLCAIHGEQGGAKEAISRSPTLTCLPKIFQTTFGRFAWSINSHHPSPLNKMPKY